MAVPSARVMATRFGFGVRRGDPDVLPGDPVGEMMSHVRTSPPPVREITPERVAEFLERERQNRARVLAREAGQPEPPFTIPGSRERLEEDLRDRALAAVSMPTPADFAETLVRFFSNMLCVSAVRGEVAGIAAAYEAEAIRPFAGGSFERLLLASASHPAMLAYLDAGSSVGPGSRLGGRRGLNENYAREVMELHTLGVDGGYSQEDVRQLALGLTGWILHRPTGRFAFESDRHEPGARTLMGRSFPEGGVEQGRAMLAFLAGHPSTARHVCTRLATAYLGPSPPPRVVSAMVRRWSAGRGSISDAVQAMLEQPESWDPAPRQPRTPEEWLTASVRLLGMDQTTPRLRDAMPRLLRKMGQYPFSAPSPQGYPLDAARWIGAEGILDRVGVAGELAGIAMAWKPAPGSHDPREMMRLVAAGDRSSAIVEGAPGLREGISLVLLCPEFMSR